MPKRTLAATLAVCLFLSTSLACSVCNITQPQEKTVTKRSVTVQPLFYKEDSTGPSGDFSNCKITVEVNKSGQPKVGFFEEEVAGSGSQWRASGWMASIIGSFLLGRDVSDYTFSYEMGGYIDGPSAGGLMTAGVLAALLGDEIKKDVTMTGTINPDGTIGPVGGVPQKIEGVKKANKKIMLIPAGQRYEEDAKTKKEVDVVETGKDEGITVKEVANIYEAYKELTGKELPKPEGATKDKVELPTDVYDKVKDLAKKWYKKYQDERIKYGGVYIAVDSSTEDGWIQLADSMAIKGEDYLKQGMVSSAYDQITSAYMYTTMAYHTKKAIQAYLTQGGLTGADNYLSTINPSGKKMDGAFDELKNQKPGTLADTMVVADAFGRLSIANGLIRQADDLMSQQVSTVEAATGNVLLATAYDVLASYSIDWALDSVQIGLKIGKAKPADKDKLIRLSEALRKAAEANLDYFDNVVLKDLADKEGMSLAAAKNNFATNELDYGFAVSAAMGSQEMKDKLGNTQARAIAVLGNSLTSFTLSSQLIAKYYSLGAQTDDNGNIIGVALEKPMINMLDFAEGSALENINAAKKIDALPVMAILAYDGGKVAREGDYEQKFSALGDFWTASMQARLLTILAGMKIKRAGNAGTTGFAKVLGD